MPLASYALFQARPTDPGAPYTGPVAQTVPGFPRLTVEADKLGGQPCIRGYRFGVEQLLELLAGGLSFDEIHADFPFLEPEDVREALGYAAAIAKRDFYVPASA